MKRKPLITLEKMLYARRKQCCLTRKFISEELGVSIRSVSYWDRGTNQIKPKHFKKLSQLLGVPLREIIDHRCRDVRQDLIKKTRLY